MKLISCLLVLATLSLCLASKIDKHSPVYVVLADSEVKHNKLISSLLDLGCGRILADACTADALFLASDFKIATIHEVSRWSDKSRSLYKFAVRHKHNKRSDLYIESRFTVEYLLSGDKRSSIVVSDYDFHFDESAALVGAYKVIPSCEYHDTLLQNLLGHGNGYICHQARYRNQIWRLPKTIANLDVLSINKISYRKLDDITYYRYDVCLGDAGHKNYKVDATFIVMLCRKTGKYAIVAVEYNVKDLISNSDCDQDYWRSDSDCSDKSDKSDSDCSSDSHKKSHDSDSDCTDKHIKHSDSDCSDSSSSDSECTDKNSHSHSKGYYSKRRSHHSDKSDFAHKPDQKFSNKFSNKNSDKNINKGSNKGNNKGSNKNIPQGKPVVAGPPSNKQ